MREKKNNIEWVKWLVSRRLICWIFIIISKGVKFGESGNKFGG